MSTSVEIPQHVLDRLDPEYRALVQASGTLPPPLHTLQWSPAIRQATSSSDYGTREPVEVGSTRTIQLGDFSLRVMTPPGEKPSRGWPVVLNIHGGGWVLCNAATDDYILSRLCIGANCVTVSVDYRLAPEHPFPAGLNDSWDALVWVSKQGEQDIGIDPKRIAIMGCSAGGNLAAVVAQRACLASPPIPLVFQNLLVPALNLSFSSAEREKWTPSMLEHEHIWALSVADVFWHIDLYVPNVQDRTKPEVSPGLQENTLAFKGMPPTWLCVADMDVLCSEAEIYAEKLRAHGIPVTLKTLKGLPHHGIGADRVSLYSTISLYAFLTFLLFQVCTQVRKYHEELVEALKDAFV
ncbi:lipase from carbohydrate esterase family CE10 protein, putative [Rhizoctonia solani AG-3 Rhs1AP]|uniref:Lipase from carbohydrate esterase family CE10 protein, putative n=1 Tax=Rhizoctonia solani AG-3 Rhs1AP TaxID=1086054 RepID=A0A0A1UII7_9AGAM|nr:lipase from carbohydrate esterase family CE10 protein, putative [Rhizoctonia solani AG-3 Rhs1AP]